MKYQLKVVWTDGTYNVYPCDTVAEAERMEKNMRMVFGNQIEWSGICRGEVR